jgi:hypothetical protein
MKRELKREHGLMATSEMGDRKQLKFEMAMPNFKIVTGNEFVVYGDDNKFPLYLLEMYQRSAKHNAIINGKTNYIFGGGLTYDRTKMNDEMVALLSEFMDNPNPFDSLNDVFRKTTMDNEIFNGYALEIVWNLGGKISSISHVPFHECRVAVDGKTIGRSKLWDGNRKPKDLEVYDRFNPDKRLGKQIFYVVTYSPNCYFYPLPEYFGAMAYIESDSRIANFHVQNLRNGFLGGFIFQFNNGVPSPEKQREIERKVKSKFAGDDGERIMVEFTDGSEYGMKLIPVQGNDIDKQFDILNQSIQQEIFTAHRVTSGMLFGIKESGQLGGRSELVESYELFKAVYVKDRANEQLRSYNYLLGFNGFGNVLEVIPTEPIKEQLSETTLLQIASRGELREMMGLPDDTIAVPKTTDSIQSLSPLVANKVLEKLTDAEIRSLVGLAPSVEPTPQTFSSVDDDDLLIAEFENHGSCQTEFVELKSRPMRYGFELKENEFKSEYEDTDKKIVRLIDKNPNITSDAIATELGLDIDLISERISALVENGSIKITGTLKEIGEPAKEWVKSRDMNEMLEIRYKYDVLPEYGPKLLETSRKFCKYMIEKNRYYTRDEINMISTKMGYSVWERRGGFYTDKKTGLTRPSCRHIWSQTLVKKRS